MQQARKKYGLATRSRWIAKFLAEPTEVRDIE